MFKIHAFQFSTSTTKYGTQKMPIIQIQMNLCIRDLHMLISRSQRAARLKHLRKFLNKMYILEALKVFEFEKVKYF